MHIAKRFDNRAIAKKSGPVFYFLRSQNLKTKMASEERSEQYFDDVDNIEEFNESLDIEPQELSNVQESVIEYNAEIFIDLVKYEPCLWNTAF